MIYLSNMNLTKEQIQEMIDSIENSEPNKIDSVSFHNTIELNLFKKAAGVINNMNEINNPSVGRIQNIYGLRVLIDEKVKPGTMKMKDRDGETLETITIFK